MEYPYYRKFRKNYERKTIIKQGIILLFLPCFYGLRSNEKHKSKTGLLDIKKPEKISGFILDTSIFFRIPANQSGCAAKTGRAVPVLITHN